MSIRKIFTKPITFLLLATSICLPTLGQTTQEKRVLPLKEAVKSAINSSTNLKLLEKQSETNRYILSHSDTSTYSDNDLAYNIRSNDQNTSYFKDKIEYLTGSMYNQLIITDLNLDLLDKKIASTQKDVDVLKLQLSHGYTDQLTLNSKQSELDQLTNTKLSTEANLTKLKEDFRILTNLSVDNYTLENNISYEPFRASNSIKAYITSRLDEMQTYSKEYAEYFDSTLGARITLPNSNQISESAYANNVLEKEKLYGNLTIEYNNNLQTLLTQYTSLIDKEKSIENINLQLEVLNKKIDTTKIKLDAGLATSIEYDKLLLEKEQLENNLINTIYQHQDIKNILNKPWVYLM